MYTELSKKIKDDIVARGDEAKARHLARFFKTGKGQYGEGDSFLGLPVPVTRSIVKKYRHDATLEDIDDLLGSPWHEIRLAGFLLLVSIYEKFRKANDATKQTECVCFYLNRIGRGNNWDLVDLVAPKILGEYIVDNPDEAHILYSLSERYDSLWHQRVAIVATWTMIKNGRFDVTFELARKYMTHGHDLIHKATGWMLREIFKRGGAAEVRRFLDKHAAAMPRTALRYAIEKMADSERHQYMTMR